MHSISCTQHILAAILAEPACSVALSMCSAAVETQTQEAVGGSVCCAMAWWQLCVPGCSAAGAVHARECAAQLQSLVPASSSNLLICNLLVSCCCDACRWAMSQPLLSHEAVASLLEQMLLEMEGSTEVCTAIMIGLPPRVDSVLGGLKVSRRRSLS
jgi:hypothetical protein